MPMVPKITILQYLEKEGKDKVGFCMQISRELFFKLILSTLVDMTIHAQSMQIKKFPTSFQKLKKEVIDEVIFFADRHQNFLQVDTIKFYGCGKACHNH